MNTTKLHLLLADDDIDDCDFFQDALDEITCPLHLTTVHNGVELMSYLNANKENQPDLLFLDLNMPRKSGMECIAEIKNSESLRQIPIIIYSTSLDAPVVNSLYDLGARYYIQKPGEFSKLKRVIKKAIIQFKDLKLPPRSRNRFIIEP